MNASNIRPIWLTETVTVDNGTVTLPEVDTWNGGVKWGQANYFIYLGTTDIALTAMKLRASTQSGTGFADVEGTIFGDDAPALPSGTDDNKLYMISARGADRYQQLVVTVGDGSVGAKITVMVLLDEPSSPALADILAAARGMSGREAVIA
jgi:hypothetical protein